MILELFNMVSSLKYKIIKGWKWRIRICVIIGLI